MLHVKTCPDGFDISLSSALCSVDEVASYVEEFLKQNELQSLIFDLLLLLREALLNAIIHGNQQRQEKSVNLQFRLFPDRIALRITDQGRGFDLQSQYEKSVDVVGTSGRGITIMKHYADVLTYDESSKTLDIVKHITGVKAP
ncbi:ATP-binding protein [Desulfovibrio inopinatus]|uniref:ATP-binding protein n=1 Tax=Desulfovibrio inopinatus TaxID=102109 RepID=UPI00040FD84F|nr:ATP-binding protein [Desulfovibrio inopinatus]